MLSNTLFSKDGKRYWPGTVKNCNELVKTLSLYPNKAQFFSSIEIDPFLLKEIEDWSFEEICYSLYFFYVHNFISQREKHKKQKLITPETWSTAGRFLLNPEISNGFAKFIVQLNLAALPTKSDIVSGLSYGLLCTRVENISKESLQNFLSFVHFNKKKSENLIKTTFSEKKTFSLVKAL